MSLQTYWDPIIDEEVNRFINQANYPCIAARIAQKRGEIRIKTYRSMGSGVDAQQLNQDLLLFIQEQKKTQSPYLSFIAVFENSFFDSEEEFEKSMWLELSAISSHESPGTPWDPLFSSNPNDKDFCFSLGGSAFFIVGLHPKSSRKGRRFFMPAMIFNLYDQFELLDEETEFYPMVKTNRKRDTLFHGDVNPMVEQYAEQWESIQFSGKKNPPEWKCPFHRTQQ